MKKKNRNIFFDTLNIILLIIAVLNCFDDIFWHIVDSKYHQICTTILLIYLFGVMINIHTANLRPTKSLGVRETESMAVGD